jgi:hypothetical protein
MKLASHFVSCGYMERNGVFYVAIKNDEDKTMEVTSVIISTWSDNWVKANNEFEDFLKDDIDLRGYSNKMFFVWNDNHRLQTRLPIINKDHADDFEWHFGVESIFLEIKNDIFKMLTTLDVVNW